MSISHDVVGYRQQERMPPSLSRYSSSPGGVSSGTGTVPVISLTRQVPHVPEVQFLGISTPASSAKSNMVQPSIMVDLPISESPLKNRIVNISLDMRFLRSRLWTTCQSAC